MTEYLPTKCSLPDLRAHERVAGMAFPFSLFPAGAEHTHLRAQVAQQRAEIERLKASRSPKSPEAAISPRADGEPAGGRATQGARTRLESEKWRRVAQAAEKAAKQAMDETAAARQEIEDLCSKHTHVEASLRGEAAKTKTEHDRLNALVQSLQSALQAAEGAGAPSEFVSSQKGELQREVLLLTEQLGSKEAALATAAADLKTSTAQIDRDRKAFEDALASAKEEASMMEDLLRREAAGMEAEMMDAFQKDGQREVDRMRQKFAAETKEAVASAEAQALEAFAAQHAQDTHDIQRASQAAEAAAQQVAEMSRAHASSMMLQEQECAALQQRLQSTRLEQESEVEVAQAAQAECVAAEAQAATMAGQVAGLQTAREVAEEALVAARAQFQTELAELAESNSASQTRTADRLGALQQEVDRLQHTQLSLRDAEAKLAALGLKCTEGAAAQAQVRSLRASNDAAQVQMARLRSIMEEAEAKAAEALRDTEAAKAEAIQATELADAARADAEQARLDAAEAHETEARAVAAAQQRSADAHTAMEVAEEQRKSGDRALESGRLRFEAELRAAHKAHEQAIEEAVLTIVRDEEAKAAAVAAAFNEKLSKTEAEYESMVKVAAEREKTATTQLALLQEEKSRMRLHIQSQELQQVTTGQSTATSAPPSGVPVHSKPEVQTNMLSATVRSKPAMHRHPRSPERSSSAEERNRNSVPSTAPSQTSGAATAAVATGRGAKEAVGTKRDTRSPHPSTPAPRKTRVVRPTRGPVDSAPVSGHSVSDSTVIASAHSRSSTTGNLDIGHGRHDGDARAALNRPVAATAANYAAPTYNEQAREKLDFAVGQWVRASAITPPPNSMASSSGRKDSYGDVWQETEELWDFDVDSDSGEIPLRPAERERANRSRTNHLLPKLPPELSCHPSVAEMSAMSPAQLAAVKDFTLTRQSYGSIRCAFSDGKQASLFSPMRR